MKNNLKEFEETVKTDISENKKVIEKKKESKNCLIVKPANKWIAESKSRPIPRMLFSELWFERELCILFADTNIGKSILAVQIANSLSLGKSIYGFKNECEKMKVLYLDCELSDKQFENRYSNNYSNHYNFSSNFLRAEINTDVELPKEYKDIESYISAQLEETLSKQNANVIIIDNLTYLKNDNEKAKDALVLMKHLKSLTKKRNISILVLAHTPKRDESKPITKNDIAGSKMLMNFCDSSFAIGSSSKESSYRYIKQIKQRNTEHVYHNGNVIICEVKKDHNFLCFNFLYYDNENEHLKTNTYQDISERDDKMKELLDKNYPNTKIAEELGISEGAVRKRKKVLGLS